MTRDELLIMGCKAAGLKMTSTEDGDWAASLGNNVWWSSDEALPAYVAERLRQEVWAQHGLHCETDSGHQDLCVAYFTNEPTASGISIEIRGKRDDVVWCVIAAALVALGKITKEQAGETLECG